MDNNNIDSLSKYTKLLIFSKSFSGPVTIPPW
jgi:hypothetical protein